jgi:hypothetical protein
MIYQTYASITTNILIASIRGSVRVCLYASSTWSILAIVSMSMYHSGTGFMVKGGRTAGLLQTPEGGRNPSFCLL